MICTYIAGAQCIEIHIRMRYMNKLIGASEVESLPYGWCEAGSAWYVAFIPYMVRMTDHIEQLAGMILVHMSIQQ